MWAYEKKLQYPVKIKTPNANYAKIIISQLGGPDGELAAATRYLNQRYSMPHGEIIGILTDVGTKEAETAPLRCRCFFKISCFQVSHVEHHGNRRHFIRLADAEIAALHCRIKGAHMIADGKQLRHL